MARQAEDERVGAAGDAYAPQWGDTEVLSGGAVQEHGGSGRGGLDVDRDGARLRVGRGRRQQHGEQYGGNKGTRGR